MPTRTAVFGSAFDPPTLGHADVVAQVATEFSRILLLPSAAHAFGKQSLNFALRLDLLEAFRDDLLEQGLDCAIEICTIEAELSQARPASPIYTYDVLEALSLRDKQELHFVLGPDNAEPQTWAKFYRAGDIEARWNLFKAEQRVDIRSTRVRSLLAQATPDLDELGKLLSPRVLQRILQLQLYSPQATS